MAEIRIGTSGYQYDHWSGDLYPESVPKSRWFEHYAGEFDTVEINNTFYRVPGTHTFEDWRERAPEGFLYALKFSQYGTHRKKLKDPESTIGYFLERARPLRDHLGPILVQLPPSWRADPDRLGAFLDAAPGDLRWAVEVRDRSWLREDVYGLLREAGAALCLHDIIEDHPREITADWIYLRYHGRGYGGTYAHQKLSADADWIADHLAEGRDVYAYFNNDIGGHAFRDAADLRRYVATRMDESALVPEPTDVRT